MRYLNIKNTDLSVSNIVLGCMRIAGLEKPAINTLVHAAMEEGINFFDHADIYGRHSDAGNCEELFADALQMNDDLREKMILQSKCGIREGYFDFSKEHIVSSAEGILKRLRTDYLDILLLHRPDPLMDPEEVAEAFRILHDSGKVRYFGVSNQIPMQMELLQKYTDQKIVVNQLQLSLCNSMFIDSGIAANMQIDQSIDRTGGVYEYCRLKDITIQAWSPFQKGYFGGVFLGDYENYGELNKLIDQLAEKYNVPTSAIAVAWLTRIPSGIQVILGTTSLAHLHEGCLGSDLQLTRKEWYDLYKAAGNVIP